MAQPPATPQLPSQGPVSVGAVHWESVFEFTHLFRAFRIAIHPAKLLLALVALTLIYTAGRAFDAVWGPRVYQNEIENYQSETAEQYHHEREQNIRSRTRTLNNELQDSSLPTENPIDAAKDPSQAYHALKKYYQDQYAQDIKDAAKTRKDREEHLTPNTGELDLITAGEPTPADQEREDLAHAAGRLQEHLDKLGDTVGHPIFDSFMKYQLRQFDNLVDDALSLTRISPFHTQEPDHPPSADDSLLSSTPSARDARHIWRSDTVTGCLLNMFVTGPTWLFAGTELAQGDYRDASFQRWLKRIAYCLTLIALAVFVLAVIALTGGMICRMAAVEFAGRPSIGIKKALQFSQSMFWSFVKTPLTPFAIIFGAGLVLALLALIGAIPLVGEVIVGIAFVIFLAGGFILMLMVLGVIGGFNLMYPTIAVEGSDSFDAISRSFSYVYARPWRMILYTVISLVYGVLTYLFVAFAVYLLLAITHLFAGWGINAFGGAHGWASGLSKMDTLWPSPVYLNLAPAINWQAMSWSEFIGACFLYFWVFLVITLIGAYVVSFYFSSNTIIYFLLRRAVDRQPLTDIYEEPAAATEPPTAVETSAAAVPSDNAPPAPEGKTVLVVDAPPDPPLAST